MSHYLLYISSHILRDQLTEISETISPLTLIFKSHKTRVNKQIFSINAVNEITENQFSLEVGTRHTSFTDNRYTAFSINKLILQ